MMIFLTTGTHISARDLEGLGRQNGLSICHCLMQLTTSESRCSVTDGLVFATLLAFFFAVSTDQVVADVPSWD
ncbi:hypothetical protein BP00DRAFT_105635 [Aspergillus indologenus CBS 114.80]|uniref:Uncharacterized protein n=1 Tax=Aspergillus indologenus CBS 114.80 TaxID=1450541 RepID=A0A2V5HLK1_9EURO|nr:hypothetical protein BP00DRAFT_105635 [Aspergillus indologenus CBS 114.80]